MTLSELIKKVRIAELKSNGVLIFDVDDTLLARHNGSAEYGESYADSKAAMLLPELLAAGMRVAIITGHGWAQLERRIVRPLIEVLSSSQQERLFVYANRGATRVHVENGACVLDNAYAESFVISSQEVENLSSILKELACLVNPKAKLPEINLRESVILSLRPIPTIDEGGGSLRNNLLEIGNKRLRETELHNRFRIDPAGKSTIEVTKWNTSKSYACGDLFTRTGDLLRIDRVRVMNASIIVGDEFEMGGNDEAIALNCPETICISVAPNGEGPLPPNVISIDSDPGHDGTETTRDVILAILKILD